MTTVEKIKQGPYGFYFEKLLSMLPSGHEEDLAEWWSETGVYEYMKVKHNPDLDMDAMFAELKRQAEEVLNV